MNRSLFLLMILIVSFSCLSFAQQNEIDSLKNLLKSSPPDTTKSIIYNNLGSLLYYSDSSNARIYAEKAYELAKKEDYAKGMSYALSTLGKIYSFRGEFYKSKNYYLQSLNICKKHKNFPGMAAAYSNIGNLFRNIGEHEKSLDYYNYALEYDRKTNYEFGIACDYNNIGQAYLQMGKYDKSISHIIDALQIFKKLEKKRSASACLLNIGNIYMKLKDFDKAIEYFNLSLAIKKEINDQIGISKLYTNIGSVYYNKADLEKALKYYIMSKDIREAIGDKNGIAIAYNNLGSVYWSYKNLEKAIEYKNKSLELKKELGDKLGIAVTLSTMSEAYYEAGFNEKALDYAMQSLEIAEDLNNYPRMRILYKHIAKIYASKNDFKKAFEYQQLFSIANDSVLNEAKQKQLVELQTRFETKRQEEELEYTIREKELIEKKQKLFWTVISISFVLFLVIVLYFFQNYRHKIKSKQLRLKQQADKEILEKEKKYKELANLLPQTVFETDINGNFTFLNNAGLEQTGYLPYDIKKGLNIKEIVAPKDRKRFEEDLKYIIEGGKNKGQEYLVIKKDGKSLPVISYINPILIDGEKKGLRGLIIDVTEQKNIETKILSTVIETEDRERKRFAEDLHDGLGPLLSSIKLYFNQLNIDGIEKTEKKEMMKYTNELIDDAISNTRTIANNLMPGTINDNGLVPAIKSFCQKLNFTRSININFKHINVNKRYKSTIETALYRIIIELINNTIKHAKAEKIDIQLEEKNNFLYLNYSDNGIGFDIEKIDIENKGLGLKNLFNRIKSINGNYQLKSGKNIGTKIKVTIELPIDN